MNLTDDDILKFQRGTPIFLHDICAIYPVKIGEIIDEGYSNFQQYLSILTATKPIPKNGDDPELVKLLKELTDFQYILMMTMTDKASNQIFRNGFRFFTHESNISFLANPPQIIVGSINEPHIIDEDKFYEFQSILRKMYFLEDGEEIIINSNDDQATKNIKMQMRANREKLRRAKAKQARQEKNDLKFSDLIGSMPLSGCGLNAVNIYDITYYMFQDQLKRSGWHEQFEINNRAAMAGAKLKKSQLKHWMRSIMSSDKS